MSINITTTSATIDRTGVKMLVYSLPGMGKTVLCATAPRPLILSAESGLLSLSKKNLVKLHPNDSNMTADFPVIAIDTIEKLEEAYQWVVMNLHSNYFDTVCLDSVSEMGEIMLTKLKAKTRDPRQAYGELIEQMSKILRNFRDLPNINVYMSAKLERVKDDATGVLTYNINMPGSKLGQELPYLFDEVFFLDIVTAQDGKTYRALRTQPDFRFFAKDRSGALDALEYPHLTHIINKIRSF